MGSGVGDIGDYHFLSGTVRSEGKKNIKKRIVLGWGMMRRKVVGQEHGCEWGGGYGACKLTVLGVVESPT